MHVCSQVSVNFHNPSIERRLTKILARVYWSNRSVVFDWLTGWWCFGAAKPLRFGNTTCKNTRITTIKSLVLSIWYWETWSVYWKGLFRRNLLDASFKSVAMFYNPRFFGSGYLSYTKPDTPVKLGRYKTYLNGCESFNILNILQFTRTSRLYENFSWSSRDDSGDDLVSASIKPALHLRRNDKQKLKHKEVYYTLVGRLPHKQKHKHIRISKPCIRLIIVLFASSENMLL